MEDQIFAVASAIAFSVASVYAFVKKSIIAGLAAAGAACFVVAEAVKSF